MMTSSPLSFASTASAFKRLVLPVLPRPTILRQYSLSMSRVRVVSPSIDLPIAYILEGSDFASSISSLMLKESIVWPGFLAAFADLSTDTEARAFLIDWACDRPSFSLTGRATWNSTLAGALMRPRPGVLLSGIISVRSPVTASYSKRSGI